MYPHLTGAGVDWKTLLQQLVAKYGPILGQILLTVLESLLGGVAVQQGVKATCPSGDCADVCAHLDKIIENAACTISCAACAKALCNQQCP